ncbi:MAG: glutamine amidotransferase [Patescibacteria group bacterium]
MKPFLILQLREVDEAADGEFQAFLKYGGLKEDEVIRIRMEKEGLPDDINLDDYSAVIVGGGPTCVSDPTDKKSVAEQNFEKNLQKLLDRIIARDFPFLGACYGLGALAVHEGGEVSHEKFTEDVGGATVKLTEEGEKDPLTAGLPHEFRVLLGHKEACQNTPPDAVVLITSDQCPVQLMRVKQNVYGVQFHPELDVPGIIVRINVYKYGGYFPPEEAEPLIERVSQENITVPIQILQRFVARYRK